MKTVMGKRSTTMALAIALAFSGVISPVHATGWPVIDISNLSQNIVTATENVAHTIKQIQQYQTQLQQHQNMLQNTLAPSVQLWDQSMRTMNDLRGAIDTLNYYKVQLGTLDAYLSKFKDTAGYRNSRCFSFNGCTPAEWSAMRASQDLGSESQKRATDALFKGLDQQQQSIEADARQLERLQAAATGATGQMQAIGFANQLASQQSNQLLQIRGLLIAQQNVVATRYQALADREALQRVSDETVLRNTYRSSPAHTW